MAADLILLGVFQGFWWASLLPWDVSTVGSQPFWITRIFAGLAMAAGVGCFIYNLYMTYRLQREAVSGAAEVPA